MKKRHLAVAILAAVLIFGASIGSAYAYFTTYIVVKGGRGIQISATTTIEEPEPVAWTKHVKLTNEAGSAPVYVRAKAFKGDQYTLTYSGDDWSLAADGYYYYSKILNGGETTSELQIFISGYKTTDVETGEDFNVVVVCETVPVQYDDNGDPVENWDQAISSSEGGM